MTGTLLMGAERGATIMIDIFDIALLYIQSGQKQTVVFGLCTARMDLRSGQLAIHPYPAVVLPLGKDTSCEGRAYCTYSWET